MNDPGFLLLKRITKRWQNHRRLAAVLLALGASLLVMALLHTYGQLAWGWGGAVLVVLVSVAMSVRSVWQLRAQDVCRFLNQHYPPVEESSELLLHPPSSLSALPSLQRQRVVRYLQEISPPPGPYRFVRYAIFASLMMGTAALVVVSFPVSPPGAPVAKYSRIPTAQRSTHPPSITQQQVRVVPPAYTGLPNRQQETWPLTIPDSALVRWTITVDQPLPGVHLIVNSQDTVPWQRGDEERQWTLSRRFSRSGYYQLKVGNQLSDLYPISIIPDQPANLIIRKPEQHTYLDYGQPPTADLLVEVSDDYGIQDVSISATLASGQGESVSFDERKLTFDQNFSGSPKKVALRKTLDLKKMGMIPGDELYFFVSALDNHRQESRSDVYFITLADTAELLSMEGMMTGVNLVPEYFRSQRQIILDTERLIAEQDTISQPTFQERSNGLGIDQKLLRLRYGKFLGEENETQIGESRAAEQAEHEEEHDDAETAHAHEAHDHAEDNPASTFGNAEAAMDAYAHKHDIAEDATFFEPELKAQLKATLSEMWKAELELRTFHPEEALPFAYKALRLLKDLQQKSRTYVAKTAVDTPPIKPETRLSGELQDIREPTREHEQASSDDSLQVLPHAIVVLETIKQQGTIDAVQRQTLAEVQAILSESAAENPESYLAALKAINQLLRPEVEPPLSAIPTVEAALHQLIKLPERLPQTNREATGGDLAASYFDFLQQTTEP